MTCFSGHSSSIYNLAINAFFFSHTSDDIEVFILVLVGRVGEREITGKRRPNCHSGENNKPDDRVQGGVEVLERRGRERKRII